MKEKIVFFAFFLRNILSTKDFRQPNVRGGSVSLDNRKRFLSGKLLVHAATWVGGKVLQ